jgi:hypothetical protein
MIRDSEVLASIQSSWKTVRISQAMVRTNLSVALVFGGFQSHDFRGSCYSLVLLFAYSVLEDSLRELNQQGVFQADNLRLATLMHSSRVSLPWLKFDLVDKGRERRNAVAHQRAYVESPECWEYVDAIEDELVAWGVLASKTKGNYAITIGAAS